MARPAKNNCDYFPHDAGMRNHKKVKSLRVKFPNGYAIWVMTLEYLTGCDGNEFEYSDMEFELMSGDFGFEADEIKSVIDYCLKIEMLFLENDFVFSESLNERLAPVYEKRGKAKELSAKQHRKNGKFCNNNTDSTVVSVTEMPQSKVNKTEVNKTKEILFNDFWELYDNKKEKDKSYSKWTKLDIETMERILRVVPMYVQSTPNKQFRKHPATWLNNKCWDDELPPSPYDPLGNMIDRKKHPSWDATYPYNETNIYYFDNKMPDKMKL